MRRADLDDLTRAAARGDEAAWTDLVMRLDAVLHVVAGRYRLGAEVDDVVQTAWLRALEHVDRMHDPSAIAGWLVTTTRREAMRTLQRGVREIVTDDVAQAMDGTTSPLGTSALGDRHGAQQADVARCPIGPTGDRAIARLREDPQLVKAVQLCP
jgi:DNA-directed RNA polymerase specialized sigma24 family protein